MPRGGGSNHDFPRQACGLNYRKAFLKATTPRPGQTKLSPPACSVSTATVPMNELFGSEQKPNHHRHGKLHGRLPVFRKTAKSAPFRIRFALQTWCFTNPPPTMIMPVHGARTAMSFIRFTSPGRYRARVSGGQRGCRHEKQIRHPAYSVPRRAAQIQTVSSSHFFEEEIFEATAPRA